MHSFYGWVASVGLWFSLLLSALWWRSLRGLCKLPAGRDVLLWLLCLWTWGIFFLMGSSVLLYMAVQQLVVTLVLSQEEMNACPSMPSSWTKSPTVSFYFIYPFVSLHYMSLALKSWVKVKVWQSTIDSFCLKQWECMWSHKDNT